MRRLKRTLTSLALNAATLTALYFGLVDKIEGAENLGLFLVWFYVVVAMVGLLSYKPSEPPDLDSWPIQSLMWPFRLATLGLLVWFGHWFVGLAYAFAVLMTSAIYHAVTKRQAAP